MKISLFDTLEAKIKQTYEEGVTIEDAEKLAAEFLHAQFQVARELKKVDLDARMHKSGLKAVRAAIYMDAATKVDKKPSDVLLENVVTMDKHVQSEQEAYDKAEVDKDELQRYYDIFLNAHIYYRGISKGRFGD